MGSNCMPNMQMPGCPPFDTPSMLSDILLWLALLLSVFALVACIIRYRARHILAAYDAATEILGHGLQAPGMIAMASAAVGILAGFGPWALWATIYGMCGLTFGVRLLMRRKDRWSDLVHLLLNVSLVYMFLPRFNEYATWTIIAFYGWFIGHGIDESWDDIVELTGSNPNVMQLLSDSGQLGMGVAMPMMVITMQWTYFLEQYRAFIGLAIVIVITFVILSRGLDKETNLHILGRDLARPNL